MISDEERREVARRLREVEGYAIPDRRVADHPITGEVIAAAVMYDLPDVKGLLGRLADLIEPESERTCRVESSHEVEGDGCYAYFEYELTCGHEIAWGDQLPPSYCPECGRRVLYDSDDYI